MIHPIEWELSGLVDENGRLGGQIQSARLLIPDRVSLDGCWLRWDFNRQPPHRWHQVGRALLNDILLVREQEEVVRFAEKWGVFGFRPLQGFFPEWMIPSLVMNDGKRYALNDTITPYGAEPWGIYPEVARAIHSFLNVAASLKSDPPEAGSRDDWQTLGIDFHNDEGVEDAEFWLVQVLNNWLKVGGITFHLKSLDEAEFDHHGLFGALGLQLLMAVSGSAGIFVCSGCALPYVRKNKRPRSGDKNWCPRCVLDGADKRFARLKYNQRKATSAS